MINAIYQSPISFSGKDRRFAKELCERAFEKIIKTSENAEISLPSSENFRAYAQLPNQTKVNLSKGEFGYFLECNSIELPAYKGSKSLDAGFSTEEGGYGGGYLIASKKIPLSTTDVHTCACLSLVNDNTNEHLLYHVYHGTEANDIERFVREKFSSFNKINIVAGDRANSNKTVNRILSAVSSVNSKAQKQFYHFPCETPEIVAQNGTLAYVKGQQPGKVTFRQVDQYFNPD